MYFDVLDGLTLVVGLGKSGLSMVRCLTRLGARLAVVDSRQQPPALAELRQHFPDVPVSLGSFDEVLFTRAARIAISPGVALSMPPIAAAMERGVPVFGDIELFARLAQAPIAAITGSNGKSTVTTLLGAMAARAGVQVAVGGNLGPPALDLLQQPVPELYVLELSSFQLETTTSLNACVATVLNLSPDHLDRYSSYADYVAAKRRIFRGDGHMVLNAADATVRAMTESQRLLSYFTLGRPKQKEFGLLAGHDGVWLGYGDEAWLASEELLVSGKHNLANALAALAMGQALGLPRAAMVAALREFKGLPHRSELVADSGGVRWFNDSKGTNVGATVAAVSGLPGQLVLIAGGEGKGQDFSPLRTAIKDKARALILIGRDRAQIAAALTDLVPVHYADDLEQAVALAATLVRMGDSVLLSPACASFDMFRNYEERGRLFAVAALRQTRC